jgi:uncharacterized protein YfaP (DUF2135 family)
MVKWLMAMAAVVVLASSVLTAEDADKTARVRGVVKEVKADEGKTDSGTMVVTVKKGDAEESVTFVVTAESSMKDGDTAVKLTDLKVKDKVRVDYKEADGKKVVTKLRVENKE